MLEHLPEWLGASLSGVRAGAEHLVIVNPALGSGFAPIALSSPAFADWTEMPVRFTADGAGVSPPLVWDALPPGTQSLALIVEDADSPTPAPLVHAIVWGLPAGMHALAEGAIVADAATGDTGKNSFLSQSWLAPDPPKGHGEHRYVFQLFALDLPLTTMPGAKLDQLFKQIEGHVTACAVLTGRFEGHEVEDWDIADDV